MRVWGCEGDLWGGTCDVVDSVKGGVIVWFMYCPLNPKVDR